MQAFLWRMLYATVIFVLFWWLFPLFLHVLHVNPPSDLMALAQGLTAAIAIIYVLFVNQQPPTPW
jgi:hypothetical protein